jgi:hypothetical protein
MLGRTNGLGAGYTICGPLGSKGRFCFSFISVFSTTPLHSLKKKPILDGGAATEAEPNEIETVRFLRK